MERVIVVDIYKVECFLKVELFIFFVLVGSVSEIVFVYFLNILNECLLIVRFFKGGIVEFGVDVKFVEIIYFGKKCVVNNLVFVVGEKSLLVLVFIEVYIIGLIVVF